VARLAEPGEDDGWFAREARPRAPAEVPARGALAELRVLELTQAWAGPFAGRLLGALGADVVKVESQRRPDGWRGPSAFGDMAPHAGHDPKELSVEISTAYNGLNRSKRHCSIDLTLEAGRDAFLDLVRAADVVIANLTARVLPNLRLTFDDLSAVNPRIILVNMPALGATGPFRDAVGYGTIVEGMGGLGSLFGPPEAGARISQTYYPDPVAGLHAALAVLSMLERRETTGTGGEIDLSHQEALWLQLGEVIVEASRGHDVERIGNRVPGTGTSGVWPVRDGRWVAVTGDAACDDLLASSLERGAEELVGALRKRGVGAREVLHYAEASGVAPMADAVESLAHPVTGTCDYLRVPLRIDGRRLDSRAPAPLFDQHTLEVLEQWAGRSADELAPALEAGAIGGAPDPRGLREFYLNRSRR
jgi:crotonobetainyl-CoA:carnitine CoA-transferase CaiB-like acyl-CoA transferase